MDSDISEVWQRVTAPMASRSGEALLPWIRAAGERARDYGRLARRWSGVRRERLLRLARREEEAAQCLRGMAPGIQRQTPAIRGRGFEALLDSSRESYRFYAANSADPAFGAVFQRLAMEQGENMALLLTLMS